MKPKVPDSKIEERNGHWYPKTIITMGGWMVAGHKSKTLAECTLRNLNYAFQQGWRAREAEMRKTLDIDGD